MANEEKNEILNEETMFERWNFKANGYTFVIEPVRLSEEKEFLAKATVYPIPQIIDKETGQTKPIESLTDKELGDWAIAIFQSDTEGKSRDRNKLLDFFIKIFCRNNYRYYYTSPDVQHILKWLESKMTINNHKVHFYDLERKYALTKAEITKLFIFFYEISGFLEPHR